MYLYLMFRKAHLLPKQHSFPYLNFWNVPTLLYTSSMKAYTVQKGRLPSISTRWEKEKEIYFSRGRGRYPFREAPNPSPQYSIISLRDFWRFSTYIYVISLISFNFKSKQTFCSRKYAQQVVWEMLCPAREGERLNKRRSSLGCIGDPLPRAPLTFLMLL